LENIEGFAAHYTSARQWGLDAMAGQLLEIADDGSGDITCDAQGNRIVNGEHIDDVEAASHSGLAGS
jgi:hypothetical protein